MDQTPVERIAEILIQVSDIQRSLRFYRDGLGIPFQPTGYGDDSYQAQVGEARLLLHPDFDDTLEQKQRGAGVIIHLWVPDVDVYHDRLWERSVTIREKPEDKPWGRHMSIVDPDGYRIDILGPIPAKGEGQ